MKIAILGAGSVGSLLGLFLSQINEDTWLITRNKDHVTRMKEEGLTLIFPDKEIHHSVKASTDAEEVGSCDLVIVMTKTCGTKDAIAGHKALFDENTYVLTLQNGIGNEDVLAEYFPGDKIGFGMLNTGATLIEPGVLKEKGVTDQKISVRFTDKNNNGDVQILKDLEILFNKTMLKAEYTTKTPELLWDKYTINGTDNLLCAIIGASGGDIAENTPEIKDIRYALMSEIADVAHAKGIPMDLDACWNRLLGLADIMKGAVPSTVYDVVNKKPTEVDAMNGYISKEGKRLGIPTPVNDTVVAIMKSIQSTYDKRITG